MGIRIRKDDNQNKNPNFLFATIRFFVKAHLGWISLLTITNTDKNHGIHDMAASCVVLKKKK